MILRLTSLFPPDLLLAMVFVSAAVVHCPAQTRPSPSDDQIFQSAMSAMQAGNLPRAQRILQGLLPRHPNDFPIDESLGLILAQEGRFADALPLLQSAVEEGPNSAVAHANLATDELKLDRLTQAAREFEASARLDPSQPSTKAALGQVYMLLKQPAQAVPVFQDALRADSTNPTLLYNTALACYQAGQSALAEPLLAHMPGVEQSAEAQSLYGDVEEALGHFEDAGKHYTAAVKIDPSEANLFLLGIEFLRHWTFDPAIKELEAGVKRFPDSTRMQVGLGVAYYGGSYYDKAIPVFAALLEKNPDNVLYAELLGRDCTVLTEGIRPECQTLISFAQKHPENPTIATYAATSILHRPQDASQMETAKTLLTQAIRTDPRLADAQFAMGLLLQQEKQWPASIPYLETAIQHKPDYAKAHYRLALAYSHQGDREKAQQEIAQELKYTNAERADVEKRLRSVTTFLVSMQ